MRWTIIDLSFFNVLLPGGMRHVGAAALGFPLSASSFEH